MANVRVFEAQRLTQNGIAVGGLASVAIASAFRDNVISAPDGAVGVEDADHLHLAVGYTLVSTHLWQPGTPSVSMLNAILDAADGAAIFFGKESGTINFQKVEIGDAAGLEGAIVIHAGSLNIPRVEDATLTINGAVRFATATKKLSDVLKLTGAVAPAAAAALTYPARLHRPHTATFDPDPAGTPIAGPNHVQSVTLSVATVELLERAGDDDYGMTAVDKRHWGIVTVTIGHNDSSVQAGSDRAAQLIEGGVGTFTCKLTGRGGGASPTLTVKNLSWQSADRNQPSGDWDHTLTGIARWRNPTVPATVWSMNGTNKIFDIA